jgi:putative transposase
MANSPIVGAGHARVASVARAINTIQDKIYHSEMPFRGHGPLLPPHKSGHQALRKGRVSLPNQIYFITTTTLERQCFFENFWAGCSAARCFENNAVLGDAQMLAWVLMPDHAHWLLALGMRDNLKIVVNRLKSSSSRLANRVLNRQGALWAPAYHDHALRAEEDLQTLARYIVANPLRAKLAQQIGDYPFWNAVWL